MFKKNLFRSAVVANGKTLRDVACALGINEVTLSRKIHGATKLVSGTTTLKLSENTIWNMKDDSVVTHLTNSDSIINLSYDDVESIFFGE